MNMAGVVKMADTRFKLSPEADATTHISHAGSNPAARISADDNKRMHHLYALHYDKSERRLIVR